MTTRTRLAFWCYAIAFAANAAWAVMFLLRSEFMPYHAEAVGMAWAQVPEPFQVLLLGLMKLAAGAWLATVGGIFAMLLLPFRQGAGWALWAVPAVGLLHYAGVINAMIFVTQRSPASPPWVPTFIGLALVVIGALLSIPGRHAPDWRPGHA